MNAKCGLEKVKIVMLCSVTLTSDSQKIFKNFYMLLPRNISDINHSDLLSGCFNHIHRNGIGLGFVTVPHYAKSQSCVKAVSPDTRQRRAGEGNPWHACRTWHASTYIRHVSEASETRSSPSNEKVNNLQVAALSDETRCPFLHLFVNNPLFNLTLMCFWCHMATNRAVSAALHTPQLGGAHAAVGAPNSDPSPLSQAKKASTSQIPKLKYEALEISEVGGPFERKVLIHYS